MRNYIQKLLGLQCFRVKGVDISGEEVLICVELKGNKRQCPRCGRWSKVRHERGKERRILHQLWGNKQVYLIGSKSRWKCKKCRKAFTEIWPIVRPWSRMSEEVKFQILNIIRRSSFRSLELDYKISDHRCRSILKKIPEEPSWEEEKHQEYIKVGIDEHSFRGRELLITITNLTSHRLKGILKDDRQSSLREWIRNIPDDIKQKIKEACIDMKSGFLKVLQEELPHTKVVTDPFHLVCDANRRLDEARRIEQEMQKEKIRKWELLKGKERLNERQLEIRDTILRKYPILSEFYFIKEQIRDMYKAKTKEEGEQILTRIIINCEASDDVAINLWGKTLRTWRKHILSHFETRTTNAFTEGVHTKIKLIKRMSYGFRNIDIYIKKMILCFLPLALLFPKPTFL